MTVNISSEKSFHFREKEDKGKSPNKTRESCSGRYSLIKFQQSFGVLFVALSTEMVSLMAELFDDLYLETIEANDVDKVLK